MLAGITFNQVLLPDEAVIAQIDFLKLQMGDKLPGREFTILRKDNSTFPAMVFSQPVFRDGKMVALRGIIVDVTEQKRIEEMKVAKETAEIASRSKSYFLAHMSHEIRTPLNAVIGTAEILADTNLDLRQRSMVDTITRESDALLEMISEILDFSKIEAGKFELEFVQFDCRKLVDNVAKSLGFKAQQRGLELIAYCDRNIDHQLIGDQTRIRQILVNLVGNAIKFTTSGEIYVQAELISGQMELALIRFSVSDTGIGIPTEKLDKIFESFTQVDASTTRKYGGTGLGTTISKRLVELMGGRIGVDSVIDVGSTFWFELSLDTGKAIEQSKIGALENIAATVLTLNRTLSHTIERYLQLLGTASPIRIDTITDFSTIAATCRDQHIHLLIIDYDYRLASGELFCDRLNDSEISDLSIIVLHPLIVKSNFAAALPENVRALAKPVTISELATSLRIFFDRKFQLAEVVAVEPDDSSITSLSIPNTVRVLFVEDYPTNQQVISHFLRDAGYQVDLADNGAIGVDMFRSKRYNIVLMDIEMPVMDGYEATRTIRLHEKTEAARTNQQLERIPIIAMTGHAVVDFLENCIISGMDDYLVKPLRKKILLETVHKWISKQVTNKSDNIETPSEADDTRVIDYRGVLEEFGNDEIFLYQVIDGFMSALDGQIAAMQSALVASDTVRIRDEAHKVRGAAANLLAKPLCDIATRLEAATKQGVLEGVAEMIHQLIVAKDEFHVYVSQLQSSSNNTTDARNTP